MISTLKKRIALFLALVFLLYPAVRASARTPTRTVPQAADTAPAQAPLPPQLLQAHKVFVSNGGGDNFFNQFTYGPDRAYHVLYGDLMRMGRYQLVSSPKEADVIFEVRSIAPTVGLGDDMGPNPQLILRVLDPATNAVLWTTTANVRALGTLKHRNRGFDQSVAVLVDKLAQATGEPLTVAQAKAVDANSRMTTAMKVLLIGGIVAAAALLGFGLYGAANPPKLPPLPPQPVFP